VMTRSKSRSGAPSSGLTRSRAAEASYPLAWPTAVRKRCVKGPHQPSRYQAHTFPVAVALHVPLQQSPLPLHVVPVPPQAQRPPVQTPLRQSRGYWQVVPAPALKQTPNTGSQCPLQQSASTRQKPNSAPLQVEFGVHVRPESGHVGL
jgi:hypothetical protein